MTRETPAAIRVVSVLLLSIGLFWGTSGCSGDAGDGAWVGYPPEKGPSDFPGMTYPPHQGGIPAPESPVWLIGLDGATWDLIRRLVARGELPNFASLIEAGAHGELLSEVPMISPALWATISTGLPRFRHGVDNFQVKLPGSYRMAEPGNLDRRSPALWELVGAAGGRSAVISWLGSYPAEPIRGYYVSKLFDPENPRAGQVHPEAFANSLSERSEVRIRPVDLDQIAKNDFLRDTLVEDARSLAVLRRIAAEAEVDFVALYLSGIDAVQHLTWRHMDPASQSFPQDGDPDPQLSGVIPAYYRFMDHALGELRELAPPDATLVVVSDHGAGPMRPEEAYHLQLELLLEEMGLLRGTEGEVYAISELHRHEKRIWLNLAGVEENGTIPPERADEVARAVRDRLAALRTDSGEALFAEIRRHTGDPDWVPGEPALTVRFSEAALFTSNVIDGERTFEFWRVRHRNPSVSGSHRPEGILLLHGPSIRPGPLGRPANLYQIAPTLLYLLGLPQDARMLRYAPEQGGVIEGVVSAELLGLRPIRMVEAYPGTDRSELVRGVRREQPDPASDEAMEKLRSLGYLR